MDFWRPNYMDEAMWMEIFHPRLFKGTGRGPGMNTLRNRGLVFSDHYRFCYLCRLPPHGGKGHLHLAKYSAPEGMSEEALLEQIYSARAVQPPDRESLHTGSVYVGLTSLLESQEKLDGKRLGPFQLRAAGCMGHLSTAASFSRAQKIRQGREATEACFTSQD
jgi:3-hydroxy-3-methylglutaryl CoA synthase